MHTLILGLDAFDPITFERLSGAGRLPNLSKYLAAGGYSRLRVADPPQSEVSWTSLATGRDPGGHGMFDFVHREPGAYALNASLLPTRQSRVGTEFAHPHNASTLFDTATQQGYPATALWWPATFPARRGSPVRTIPGLGTPDIQGRLGVGTAFTSSTGRQTEGLKTQIETFQSRGRGVFAGQLSGPKQGNKSGTGQSITAEFLLDVSDPGQPRLKFGRQVVDLNVGKWSPTLEVNFQVGLLFHLRAITRAILTATSPEPQLYFLPLQIHPLHSPWPYATPPGFVRQTWKEAGPFLTLGWPQDTTALEEGWINDEQFLDLCLQIERERERALMLHLDHFPEGVLACVFDTLDRVQHMFWRDRMDVVETWYEKLDGLVGRVEKRFPANSKGPARLLIVSDHGFGRFDYKVHLNRWLVESGYLATNGGGDEAGGTGSLRAADWGASQAYAIGLNSLYLNLEGREGQGNVPASEAEALRQRIKHDLMDWTGPDGRRVVQQALTQSEAFSGPLAAYGPDLLIGYTPGYRASAQTGLGAWESHSFEPNRDHWGADHCFAAPSVPGVIFSSLGLQGFSQPSYVDFPALATGTETKGGPAAPPPTGGESEDQDLIEERLKSLGYL